MNNNRLTEENLKKLDEKIGREHDRKQHQEDVLSEHRSQKSGASKRSKTGRPVTSQHHHRPASRGNVNMDDAISVKSYASSRMSGASNLSKKSGLPRPELAPETRSLHSDLDTESRAETVDNLSNLNEEDEWCAIQNFNTILHYEEQKQMMMREKERKRLIKDELDRQVREKNLRKRKEKHEDQLYDELQ